MSWVEDAKDAVGNGAGAGGAFFALKWLWTQVSTRFDKRQAQLDAEHETLDMSWKEYRLQLESRMKAVEVQNRALLASFQHVSVALIRLDPASPALAVAERLMAAAFPTDFTMAGQMAAASLDLNEGVKA